MTKNELIDSVVDTTRTSKVTAASAVDATFDIMTATLKQGEGVMITGFGKFTVVERTARDGRDPRTGALVRIAAGRRVRFSAGKGLREAVNG